MKSHRKQALLVALTLVAVTLVAGCGGGSSSSAGGSGGASASTGSSSVTKMATTSTGSEAETVAAAVQADDPVSEGSSEVTIEPRDAPLGVDNDEIQTTGAKRVKPCKLVTTREAAAILGQGTKAVERPQGPTCVYANAGRVVTLVVEDNSVKQLREGARKATKVEVGGKTGWCVKYQSTAVIVGIGGGRLLRADGPCQAGVRFVTKALTRI